jgi:glycosyltransferase involved in cell wall biosynthesis
MLKMLKVRVLYEHGRDGRPHGSSYIRLLRPLTHPGNRSSFETSWGIDYESADVVIVDRLWKPAVSLQSAEELIRRARNDGACLIYAIDDNLLDLELEGPVRIGPSVDQLMVVRYFAREADGIIVSTARLKERLIRFNNRIIVVPNALDERLIEGRMRTARRAVHDGPKVIGYMGTHTHDADIMMINQTLREISRKYVGAVEIQFVGAVADSAVISALDRLPFRVLDVSAHVEYPAFMNWMMKNIWWDLGIAPLEEDAFTQCKSDIKFLDYSAMGIAGIYSRVPAYEETVCHLETGYLASNNTAGWLKAIDTLLTNDSLRRSIAEKAGQYLFSTRTLKQCAQNWGNAISSIMKGHNESSADVPIHTKVRNGGVGMSHEQKGLRIDIGCGSIRKQGTIGIDIQALPEVDHVLDIEQEPLPFNDRTVEYVHSSHFLEHIENATAVFAEIGRVCQDNARLELWTPYAWSNSAFILGHKTFFTEDIYLHMCLWFTDFWESILHSRWILNEIQYVIDPAVLCYLGDNRISLDYALRHLKNIAREFCAHITVLHGQPESQPLPPKRTFSVSRGAPRYEIRADRLAPSYETAGPPPLDETTQKQTDAAIKMFANGRALPPWE